LVELFFQATHPLHSYRTSSYGVRSNKIFEIIVAFPTGSSQFAAAAATSAAPLA